ncbi:MAG TPA: efflux RND transporter periplasmic adaptor subunit [Bacillota bacterium]
MSKRLVTGLLIVIIIGCAAGFFIQQGLQKRRQANLESLYETVTVAREDLNDTVDATGTLSFSQNGELYPAYNATVLQINKKVGDWVKKGEVLMVLDSSKLKEEWMEAQNTYQKALANYKLAQKTLERNRILYQAQGITIDEVEQAQNNVDTYSEDLKLAKFNLERLQKNPDGVNYLSSDRTKLLIKAPFDGVIAWIDVKPGETVEVASSTSSASTLLLTLAADNSVIVTAEVDESEIDKVKPGQKAIVTLNDKQSTELEGKVTAVGKIGTEDAGVVIFPVEIKVELPPVKVNSGMTADVTIQVTSRKNRLAIPAKAVIRRRGRTLVRVARGKEVAYVPVKLGEEFDTNIEVLAGLEEGDAILIPRNFSGSGDAARRNFDRQRNRGPMGGPMGGPPMRMGR